MSVEAYPKYDSYQAVSLPWCHAIPSHWHTEPIRNLFIESRKKNSDGRRTAYLSLMANRGIIPYAEKGDVGNKMPSDLSGCKIVEENDFVLNSMNFGIGSFGVSPLAGVCSSVYVILQAKNPSSIKYYERIFQHPQFQTFSQSLGNGILAHRCAIGWDEIKNAHFPCPPDDERVAIAAFLDEKCAKIDEAVRIEVEQIALLRERRQILIQQAVTRGLNPSTPLKDSGIAWIGTIPAHWEVRRSKFLFAQSRELARKDDVQLSATQSYGVIPQDKFEELVGRRVVKISTNLEKRKHVELDDFVISMRSFQGGLERAHSSGCIRSSYVILRPSSEVNPNYFGYLLKSPRYIQALQITGNFIRDGQDLTFENFADVSLFIPPMEEQAAIAQFIAEGCKKIDKGVAVKEKQIATLKEYKTSLIDAAVTGRIKVI